MGNQPSFQTSSNPVNDRGGALLKGPSAFARALRGRPWGLGSKRRHLPNTKPPLLLNESANQQTVDNNVKFPLKGIKVGYLRSLQGRVKNEWTVYDICKEFVIPVTIESKLSYCEWLDKSSPPSLSDSSSSSIKARADIFVSYAWKYTWGQLLEAFEKLDDSTAVWLDVFVVNQHQASEVNLDEWLETFSGAIKSIGKVLFIFAPWRCPTPVTRAWCVFEILTTLQTDVHREIVVPKSELETLLISIVNGELGGAQGNEVMNMLRDINVMRAQAYKEEDRRVIMEKIKQRGVIDVNNVVLLPIKQWYLEAVKLAVNERTQPFSMERGNAYEALYGFEELLGKPVEGLEAAEKALECWERCGAPLPKMLAGHHLVGTALSVQGDWNGAGERFEKCIEQGRDGVLPAEQYIQILQQYCSVLIYRNQLDEAVSLGSQALEMSKQHFGDTDSRLADSASTLGALLKSVNRVDEAKTLFELALDVYKKTLGEDHPRISMALTNLAVTMKLGGDCDGAIKLYEESLFITKRVMGDDHVELASIYNNIASAYLTKGDVHAAYENGNKAYVMWNRVLGPEHQMTVMANQVM